MYFPLSDETIIHDRKNIKFVSHLFADSQNCVFNFVKGFLRVFKGDDFYSKGKKVLRVLFFLFFKSYVERWHFIPA